MKKFLLIPLLLSISAISSAQEDRPPIRPLLSIESVQLNGGAWLGLDRKPGIASTGGYGSMVELRLHLTEALFLGVSGGYGRTDVEEADPITAWNWGYWNRLYRNYIVLWLGSDSAYFGGQLQSLRAISNPRLTAGRWTGKDSLYSVQLTPKEYMNTYPIAVTLGASWQASDAIELSGGVSLVAVPFERNLYLDESWTKRRLVDAGPDSGSWYVFNYGFRNFANSRRGTAWGGGAHVAASVDLGAGFSAYGHAQLIHFSSAIRSDSYAVLPVKRMVTLGAGVRVRY